LYARGIYIYSFFGKKQNRFAPLEAQASAFLYRTPLSKKDKPNEPWYYETETLKLYRERLDEKIGKTETAIKLAPGIGVVLNGGLKVRQFLIQRQNGNMRTPTETLRVGTDKSAMKAEEFLEFYREKISCLPRPGKNIAEYLDSLKEEERSVLTSLLPTAATLKKRHTKWDFCELFEATRAYYTRVLTAAK
jgi:hypothetical protein